MMPAVEARLLVTTDPAVIFERFLEECAAVGVANTQVIRRIALQTIGHLRGTAADRGRTEAEQILQNRWYHSLQQGKPDWTVYQTDYYLAEMWACWIVYSRKYLNALYSARSLPPHGLLRDFGPVRRVADLGCGIGFTSASLKQMFPQASVTATNLGGTAQTAVAKRLGKRFGFEIVEEVCDISAPVDLVFASEYFEHIPNPVEHLDVVLRTLRPRCLLIANSFGTRAIGHFETYDVNGRQWDGKMTSKLFNQWLRSKAYRKVPTKMWNQRPAYWKALTA